MQLWNRSNSFLTVCGVALVFALGGAVFAQDLIVDSPITISSDATYDNVFVQNGGVLTVDAILTVTNDMNIESGGSVNHSHRFEPGLVLNVAGVLDVQSGGLINLDSRGLRGGRRESLFGAHGEAYDSGGNIVSGAQGGEWQSAGASHGGWGAASDESESPNSPYGLLEDAGYLGSGGGATWNWNVDGHGGNGGGLVEIVAGDMVVDGEVRANGGSGVATYIGSGGGSGGSIYLDVGTLSGTGTIQAVGGQGGSTVNGSGGGGRIVIEYTENLFPESNIIARGGSSDNSGAAGTIYLKAGDASYGSLIIDNWNIACGCYTPVRTELGTIQSAEFQDRGQVLLETSDTLTVEERVTLTNVAVLRINGIITVNNTQGFDLDVQSGSTFVLESISTLNASAVRVNASTMTSYRDLSFPMESDLELSGGGTINMLNNTRLSLGDFNPTNIASGTVYISIGSQLDVNSLSVTVGDGVTLVKDGRFGVLDTLELLTVQTGGTVTHSVYSGSSDQGLQIDVTGTLDIQSGGAVDVSGKGLRGGKSSGNNSVHGETYNNEGEVYAGVTGNVIIGSTYYAGAGASYGGQGGYGGGDAILVPSNAVYGVFEDPIQYGSGGGGIHAGSEPPNPGGNGGGLVHIVAETCTVDGVISANGYNGGSGYGTPGGGSGGCIYMDVGDLDGNGTIKAIGGIGGNAWDEGGGSGSGGRIAIFFDSMTIPIDNLIARGGSSNNSGAAGTVYSKASAHSNGGLIIDNGSVVSRQSTPYISALFSIKDLFVTDQGVLDVVQQISVENVLSVTNGGRVENNPE